MARGGKRSGAGRKTGSPTRRRQEIAIKAASEGISPLEVMLGAMRTAWTKGEIDVAARIAKDAAPYVHAGSAVQEAAVSKDIAASVLIGVDLGPNLSVKGSLATILWLPALRRESLDLSGWKFLKIGLVVMPPALPLAIGSLSVNYSWWVSYQAPGQAPGHNFRFWPGFPQSVAFETKADVRSEICRLSLTTRSGRRHPLQGNRS